MTDRDQADDRDEKLGEWRAQEGSPSPSDDEYWDEDDGMKVFEYLIMLDETRDADGRITEAAEILVPVSILLAKDQTQATTLASRLIPEDVFNDQEKFDRLIVVVRPF